MRDALLKDGVYHPIDFANACPDSQVTSLHYFFPWLVKAMVKLDGVLRGERVGKMHRSISNWGPYYEIADQELPYRERVAAYAAVAREHFESDRFEAFCAEHLAHLDEVALEFFGTERALEAVRLKVQSLFPAHEVEEYTEHFWGLIEFWRKTERDRIEAAPGATG